MPAPLVTPRLRLRALDRGDAPFILALLNDPGWLGHIGDRGVRTLTGAQRYLRDGPLAMYARHGVGLMAVTRRRGRRPMGLCGLIKRDDLDDVDLGFAFLPEHRGQGYAREAAAASLAHGHAALGLRRIVAIVAPGNARSIHLLTSIGMRADGTVRLRGDGEPLGLYVSDVPRHPRDSGDPAP